MSLDISLYVEVSAEDGSYPHEYYLYNANYTHNVTNMWREAGVYDALYNSDGVQAGSLVSVLEAGVVNMQDNLAKYEAMNPGNGWGDSVSASEFLKKFTDACKKHPKSIVDISK